MMVAAVDSDFDLNYEPFEIQFHHYNQDKDYAQDESHVVHLTNGLMVHYYVHGHYLANVNDYWTDCDQKIADIDLKILHFDLSEGEVTNGSLGVSKEDQVRGKIIETIDCTSVEDVLVNSDPTEGLGTGDNIGFGFVKNIIKGLFDFCKIFT